MRYNLSNSLNGVLVEGRRCLCTYVGQLYIGSDYSELLRVLEEVYHAYVYVNVLVRPRYP
jgi:hypothetical protein